jgi:hypothetical protein
MWTGRPKRNVSPEEKRILRKHWEWSGNYALLWIIGTIIVFGGMFLVLDFLGAEDRVKVPSLILLATISIVNAIWRAAGVVSARVEVMISTKPRTLSDHRDT